MSKQFYQFIGIFVCFLTFTGIYAQNPIEVSKVCLGCICEAVSGCKTTLGCNGDVCGPFRITHAYWVDAGKPTLNNEANTNEGAYPNCVNDAFCAGNAVESYMKKFGRDCNGDGIVNCDDYIRIHRYGKNGCMNQLDSKLEYVYKTCIQMFN
ncbi:PREDICTED: lysozyme-like [Polistes dominula]|uniref:lysozyme n=1 Tax=Polistes dominula TaxID=743375 RepID=A0ABM1J1C0_POLDO|nr:PREDICTED: lysozyme-like [Polistes dominula]